MVKFQINEFLTIELKDCCQEQHKFLEISKLMMPLICEDKELKDEIMKLGIVEFWLELGCKLKNEEL